MDTAICRDGAVTNIYGNDPVIMEGGKKLVHTFVVRMIGEYPLGKKCIAEEEFEEHPTDAQIAWCLLKHPDASFASVTDRFQIKQEEVDLPFG